MKTHRVRPVFLLNNPNDESAGGIFNNKDRNWYNPILISLEDEKIKVGDLVFNTLHTNEPIHIVEDIDDVEYHIKRKQYKKVIATQSQIAPELIQQLVNKYNNGGMQDFEIEIEDRFGYCDKCNAYQYTSYIACNYPHCGGKVIQKDEPKLTNGFVTVVKKEPILYTEEDLKESFDAGYERGYELGTGEFDELSPNFETWFNNNKKK